MHIERPADILHTGESADEMQLLPGMEVVDLDLARIAIDSKAMEEKALAFESLPEYLSTIDANSFQPYLDQALVATLETVDFIWEPSARVVSQRLVICVIVD